MGQEPGQGNRINKNALQPYIKLFQEINYLSPPPALGGGGPRPHGVHQVPGGHHLIRHHVQEEERGGLAALGVQGDEAAQVVLAVGYSG